MIGGNNPNLPVRYGSSYKSNTAMAANTPDTIFSAAANVNGAIVHLASFFSINATTWPSASILAKASAPTSAIDGDVILQTSGDGANNRTSARTEKSIYIPPGKGLYYIVGTAETNALRSCLYTLL